MYWLHKTIAMFSPLMFSRRPSLSHPCLALALMSTCAHADGVPNELDGKVTVVSRGDRQLCEVRFPNTVTCAKGAKLRVLRGGGTVWDEVGTLEVVAVAGRKLAGRCVDFDPRAGDIVEQKPVAVRPTKHPMPTTTPIEGSLATSDARVELALDEHVTLDAVGMPLNEAMNHLAEFRGIPIVLDEKSLEAVGLKPDAPITFSVTRIKLKAVLDSILGDLGLRYKIEHGMLKIAARTIADRQMRAHVVKRPVPPPKPRKPPTAEINYAMEYNGAWVHGVSTFIFTVTIQEVDESKGKARVRLENIRRHWTAISNAGKSGSRETNIGSMPFTDPRGYKSYGAPAAWGESARIGDLAWVSVTELKNHRGEAGAISETRKADTQMAVGALVVGGLVAATSDGGRPAASGADGGKRFQVGQKVKNPSLLVLWKGTIVRVGGDGTYVIRVDYVANLSGRSPYRKKGEYSFVEGEFKESGGISPLEIIGN